MAILHSELSRELTSSQTASVKLHSAPQMDSELEGQARVLCFLECFLADTRNWIPLFPVVCAEVGGRKGDGILWVILPTPLPPVLKETCRRDGSSSKTKTFT